MLFFYPFLEQYQFDSDEGINLMKAMLAARGYPLYSQIWSDQPPLFTYLLAFFFRLFGSSVVTGRLLVLAMSSLMLGVLFYFQNSAFGLWHALAGTLLIILLPYFNQLSVSTMIGQPALAFTALSLAALAAWHQGGQRRWLVFSALAMSAAMLTKLYVAYLAVIFTTGVLVAGYIKSKNAKDGILASLLWAGVCGASLAGFGLLWIGPANLNQLITPHIASVGVDLFENQFPIEWYLQRVIPYIVLALAGSAALALRRRWLFLYPFLWALGGYILLRINHPTWYHHQLLITIPLAILAGIGAGEMVEIILHWNEEKRRRALRGLLALISITGLAWVCGVRLPGTVQEFGRELFPASLADDLLERIQPVIQRMQRYAPLTQWAVSDQPMIPFRAGIATPPELAVFSKKRINSGSLTEAQIIAAIDRYQPEQVLLTRFELPAVDSYLEAQYRLLYELGKVKIFIRSDLLR